MKTYFESHGNFQEVLVVEKPHEFFTLTTALELYGAHAPRNGNIIGLSKNKTQNVDNTLYVEALRDHCEDLKIDLQSGLRRLHRGGYSGGTSFSPQDSEILQDALQYLAQQDEESPVVRKREYGRCAVAAVAIIEDSEMVSVSHETFESLVHLVD